MCPWPWAKLGHGSMDTDTGQAVRARALVRARTSSTSVSSSSSDTPSALQPSAPGAAPALPTVAAAELAGCSRAAPAYAGAQPGARLRSHS
eukprot:4017590-Prymnesium_polylepis.1